MRGLWQELTDLVLPGGCAGCGAPRARRRLCDGCREVLGRSVARRVSPSPSPEGLPVVYAALAYADEARAALLAHKERGALPLAGPLGTALAGAVRAAAAPEHAAVATPLLLVPVPSARRAVAARGHDPVRRMALVAAAVLRRGGRSARVLPMLRRRRAVADQAGLSADERAANLSGALETVPGGHRLPTARDASPPAVVLVDDLVTTGATLAEAARVVTARTGASPSAAVVAARGMNYQKTSDVTGETGEFRPIGGTCQ